MAKCRNRMQPTTDAELTSVIDVIGEVTSVTGLDPDQEMYDAGVTSIMALPLLMELETRFAVTIPDDSFISARTPRELYQIIMTLKREQEN